MLMSTGIHISYVNPTVTFYGELCWYFVLNHTRHIHIVSVNSTRNLTTLRLS